MQGRQSTRTSNKNEMQKPGPDGHKPRESKRLLRSQWDSAFHTQQGRSAIDLLVLPGEEIQQLLMRAFFSSKRNEGHRLVRAFMRHIAKCQLAHNDVAEQEAMNVIAGDVAVDNARVKQLVAAIIGENRLAREDNPLNRFVNWSLGSGKKKDYDTET